MAEAPLRIEYEYFPDPTRGRPVSNGAVYSGVENSDPTVLANRVDVVLIQQDGTRVVLPPTEQPFGTSPGGVIEYQGSPAIIRVDGVVSIAVHDSNGAQVYYNPAANQSGATSGGGAAVTTTGVPLNGSFETETETVAGQADNWTYAEASNGTIDVDSTNQAHGFKSLRFLSASAAGSGTATSDRFNVLSSGKSDVRFNLKSTSVNVQNTVQIRYYNAVGTILTTNTIFSDGATNPANFAAYLVTDLAPTGAVEAEIILAGVTSGGATTSGTTWFDDVKLTDVTGTYEVGATGSVIQTVDAANSVNNIRIASAAAGQAPTVDQLGDDDIGVLIEQVLIKNGVITGDLVGDVTGEADTVTIVPLFTGDIDNDGGGGVPTNNLIIKDDVIDSSKILFTASTGDQQAYSDVPIISSNSVGFIRAKAVRVPYSGIFKLSLGMRSSNSFTTVFADVIIDGTTQLSFSTTSTTTSTKTGDITVVKNDIVDIQFRTASGSDSVSVESFLLSELDNRTSFVEI